MIFFLKSGILTFNTNQFVRLDPPLVAFIKINLLYLFFTWTYISRKRAQEQTKTCHHQVATALLSSRWRARRGADLAPVEELADGKSFTTDALYGLRGFLLPLVMIVNHRVRAQSQRVEQCTGQFGRAASVSSVLLAS